MTRPVANRTEASTSGLPRSLRPHWKGCPADGPEQFSGWLNTTHHIVTTSPTGRPEVARVALTPASVRIRLADDPGTAFPSLNDRTAVVVGPPANAVSALVQIMAAATMLPANILTFSSFDL